MAFRVLKSPIGDLTLIASDKGILRLLWEEEIEELAWIFPKIKSRGTTRILDQAESQIVHCFLGKPITVKVPLDLTGTPFQKNVWRKLFSIPWGTTLTYGDLAGKLGDVNKARAVGSAVGKNPIPILIPCHRVLGAKDQLGGFSGGISKKKYLLELERNHT